MHLVDDFDPQSGFFYGTSTRSLLANGSSIVLPGRGRLAPHRAETILSALGPGQILVGAVPFDDTSPAHLVIPERHQWGPALPGSDETLEPQSVKYAHEPTREHYLGAVASAMERIEQGPMSKVVIARSIRVELPEKVDIPRLLRTLRHRQNSGFVFGCSLPGGKTLVGGSPELLVSRNGNTVTAYPLAGSRPRSLDETVNRRHRDDLLGSDKDRREHALVVDHIARALQPYCSTLTAPSAPHIVTTANMLHLGTRITGTLDTPLPSALSLASALHPTPAVGGTPTGDATRTIKSLEGFSRDFYAGMVGWCDSSGDGQWAVTIRCTELSDESARLFAGAGVVRGSTPGSELAETDAKLATMLSALGFKLEKENSERHLHTVAR
ncbi:MAG TPA: isochorismate synthase [Candidatus Stackebrandtia excrementipullorum]|nr:isochorismate synthase [Candidatus Stackebrandtia excrementipullorum]